MKRLAMDRNTFSFHTSHRISVIKVGDEQQITLSRRKGHELTLHGLKLALAHILGSVDFSTFSIHLLITILRLFS